MKVRNIFIAVPTLLLAAAHPAAAVCPVCTLAVGAGLGLAQWLGIDDTISGVWIGGLVVSVSYWTDGWLAKKNIRYPARLASVIAVYAALIFVPFYFTGVVGHPLNRLWGIDKLALGSVTGAAAFAFGAWLHGLLKRRHGGRSYFPFQKVAVPVAFLIVATFIYYCVC